MLQADPAIDFVAEVLAGRAPQDLGPAGSDLDRTVELLRFHRLTGLWYSEVRAAGAEPVGNLQSELGASLKDQYLKTGFHSTLVLESAQRARAALSDADIPSIAFKGVALLLNGTYLEPARRSLDDADVLVPESSAGAAVAALEAAGFAPWVEWDEARVGWLPAFTFTDGQAPKGMPVRLDLHWRTPYASFRTGSEAGPEMLWEGADLEAGLPAEEPHFLLLVEHFLKHLRVVTHVRALGDMVRSLDRLARPDLLADLAARRGSLRGLRVMLAFVRDGLCVQVADPLLSAVGVPAELPHAPSRVLNRARLLGTEPAVTGTRFRGLRSQWVLGGSPSSILRDAFDVMLPPRSWLDQRYPQVSGAWSRRRLHHMKTVAVWLMGRGVSPLSPNQEFEE